MSHAEETVRLWHETGWIDVVCQRWEEFFGSMVDQPERTEALCMLGLQVLRGEALICPHSGSSRWMGFFGVMASRPEKAQALCDFGLEVVRRQINLTDESTRSRVRSILRERWRDQVVSRT